MRPVAFYLGERAKTDSPSRGDRLRWSAVAVCLIVWALMLLRGMMLMLQSGS